MSWIILFLGALEQSLDERIRISVELPETPDGNVIWSK